MLEHSKTLKLIVLAQNGDEQAKTELLENNSPLIKSVIKPYKNKGIEYDDLYQLGCLGFLKAIKNFNPDFNVKFSTYAVPMVAGEVKRFLRDDGSIKVSRALKSLNIQITHFINDYKKEFNDNPTIETISNHFKIDQQEVVFAMDSRKALLSLDERQDETNSRSRSLIEMVDDDYKMDNFIDELTLKDLIKNLPNRDRQLIALRFFKDKTQSEIADMLGVSQVQISRLENKILEKLRNKFLG